MMPRAGRDYPGSVGELLAWFSSGAGCRDYLEWLRWPEGFVCSQCGHAGGWRLGDGRWMCAGCSHRTSVTAHDLRPDPHPVDGVVQRVLGVRDGQGRDLRAEPAADLGDRLVPDRVGDAAPVSYTHLRAHE